MSPIYEYQCTKCGHHWEWLHSYKDKPKCIECGGKLKRLYSGRVGLQFKGSGFYVNDYKKRGDGI